MSSDVTTTDGRRRKILKSIGAAGLIGLAGCTGNGNGDANGNGNGNGADDGNGNGADDGNDNGAGDEGERIAWHAGGTGGTYYPLSNEFKTIVEADTPHTLQVQSTGASVENVGSLEQGAADFALIQNDIAFFARNGESLDVFEGAPVENLRGVATLYPETIHIVVNPDSNITSFEDLEGTTVNTGDLGSGTQVNALQILETVGITTDDFTEQNDGFDGAADQLRDGDIDAAFVVGGWPVGAISDLAETAEIELLNIDDETREDLLAGAEWFANDTIPGGTYSGIDEDVNTISVQAMIATREEYDADIVEEITETIFENVDQLTIKEDFINTESAQDGMSIELHEGAARYFE
ncbi:TAXI family TRAP transporter solute-binding subunit [Natronocalculus amylovorans]|uniref:TAXI family TRAP transporter solute-binding subunit n=1 Tax=Natronocalculus amylovorans TaxID=2917812 RepID=A0AAE3K9A3_9EURY|nr:TAXI family TRAP transporter solute-binding subunit [Natronocalculus amylovorans]MCL9817360.1 TAXI family TRAP transporter solute-binding subunit [Natronocalculus amylovorans]